MISKERVNYEVPCSHVVLVLMNTPASAGDVADVGRPLGWEYTLEEGMASPLVFLPRQSHGQKSLAGNSL